MWNVYYIQKGGWVSVEPHVVLISQMDEQWLRTLGLQLAQGTAELGRRRGRWRVFSKDDSGARGSGGAASHLVLDKLVDVLQPEVGEARAAGQEVGQRLLDCRARHNRRWRFLKEKVAWDSCIWFLLFKLMKLQGKGFGHAIFPYVTEVFRF